MHARVNDITMACNIHIIGISKIQIFFFFETKKEKLHEAVTEQQTYYNTKERKNL